jgi:hypothetical protein
MAVALFALFTVMLVGPAVVAAVVVPLFDSTATAIPAPETPPTMAATAAASTTSPALLRFLGAGGSAWYGVGCGCANEVYWEGAGCAWAGCVGAGCVWAGCVGASLDSGSVGSDGASDM